MIVNVWWITWISLIFHSPTDVVSFCLTFWNDWCSHIKVFNVEKANATETADKWTKSSEGFCESRQSKLKHKSFGKREKYVVLCVQAQLISFNISFFFLPSIVFLHVAKNAIPFFAEIDRILNYSAQLTGANFIRKFKICSLNELNFIHSHCIRSISRHRENDRISCNKIGVKFSLYLPLVFVLNAIQFRYFIEGHRKNY